MFVYGTNDLKYFNRTQDIHVFIYLYIHHNMYTKFLIPVTFLCTSNDEQQGCVKKL